MKKINLTITGCLGRMGQQLVKSSKSTKKFKLVSITENRMINKKVECMNVAKKYGYHYWDGDRKYGYGGYEYNPKFWEPVVPDFIKYYNEHYDYLADPHTATGLYVLERMSNDQPAISLACADPGKFSNAIKEATGSFPHFRPELENIFDQKEKMTILDNNTDLIKLHILELI